jgi:hypothetical protein
LGVFQATIWKSSIFKNIGFLLSSAKKVQPTIFVSEAGIVSFERMPLATGYVFSEKQKVAWMVNQKAKVAVQGIEQLCMLISERSYMPLDPFSRTKGDKVEPLKNIAKAKHDEEKSRAMEDNRKDANTELLKTMFYLLTAVMVIALIIYLLKR